MWVSAYLRFDVFENTFIGLKAFDFIEIRMKESMNYSLVWFEARGTVTHISGWDSNRFESMGCKSNCVIIANGRWFDLHRDETMFLTHLAMVFLHWVSVGFSTWREQSHDCQSSIGSDLEVWTPLVAKISPWSSILFDEVVLVTTTLEMNGCWTPSARSNAEA